MQSENLVDENIENIGKLFPNCITEGKDENGKLKKLVDFDLLKQELSKEIVEGSDERYTLNWPGKKQAILTANSPINATLRPCREESVDFDNTKNLYIEGDNLDVLKLLRETYLGIVKMIYIDPPYNTGNDFVYNDDFATSTEDYLLNSKSYDEQGNRMFLNNDSNGRFHTDWLNMIYPRLKLAKDLLADDGVIFISIDEYEINNMLKICNEIFGEYNFIENFIWIKNSTKNLSKTTSTNHEYILCYAKNKTDVENNEIFRVEKPGLKEVQVILKEAINNNWGIEKTEQKLKEFYRSRDNLKGISMYDRVDSYLSPSGQQCYQAYRLSDTAAPKATGKAATYEILHPITGKPCKCPQSGWRYTKETMNEHIKNNLIYFYDDETHVPQFKRYLDTVTTEVIKSTFEDFAEGKKELMRLFNGDAYFENAKPTTVISKFLRIVGKEDIILDFFSGSATTAHAVMQLNAEDGGHRKFIMVQLPEICDEKSEAYKAGYKNICEIGKERIRRAGKKIKEENPNAKDLDIGFRVFKLDSSCMKDVYYNPENLSQDLLAGLEDNIKDDRTPEDLLFQVMLDMGVMLSSDIKVETIAGKKVFNVNDGNLVCCFDKNLTDEVVKEIAKMKPRYAVFRDSSMATDSVNVNFDQIFETYHPSTTRKVL